jgi:hypothetical protein
MAHFKTMTTEKRSGCRWHVCVYAGLSRQMTTKHTQWLKKKEQVSPASFLIMNIKDQKSRNSRSVNHLLTNLDHSL